VKYTGRFFFALIPFFPLSTFYCITLAFDFPSFPFQLTNIPTDQLIAFNHFLSTFHFLLHLLLLLPFHLFLSN